MKTKKIKAVFNWSGGKDSAHALLKIIESGLYDIVSLLTTIDEETNHSPLHGIPVEIFKAQALSVGLPLYVVNGSKEEYTTALLYFKSKGVTHFIFGDIFLDEVRQYRERQLSPWEIEVVEPL